MNSKITEDNFIEHLANFVEWKYKNDMLKSYNSCPYDLDLDNDDLIYKQIFTWFVYDRINTKTGITVLDEFVEQFVKEDGLLASKILQMKELFFDEFKILQRNDDIMIVKAIQKSKVYKVQIIGAPEIYTKGRYLLGRIHPWYEDGTHRTCGILKIRKSDEEMLHEYGLIIGDVSDMITNRFMHEFQEKAESISITKHSKLVPSLKKYPIEWIDQICISLHLDSKKLKKKQKVELISSVLTSKTLCDVVCGLFEDEKIGLRFVMDKNGIVKYSEIQKRLGKDDTKMQWDKKFNNL